MEKVAIIVPAYKRPEYTKLCLESVYGAQDYGNSSFYLVDEGENEAVIRDFARPCDTVVLHSEPHGLRNTIIEFIQWVLDRDFTVISKIDNDCLVPKNWLSDMLEVMNKSGCDILSPNTSETNAAYKYGAFHKRVGDFIPSQIVGGLWTMRRSMIEEIYFEKTGTSGIRGAFHIINQIVHEKEPKIGWTDRVTFEDVGYWSGSHPMHIKSEGHALYSAEVGRPIAWRPECP